EHAEASVMEPVSRPVLQDSQAMQRAQFDSDGSGGVRLVCRAGTDRLLAGVKGQLTDVQEIPSRRFVEVHIGPGLAEEELSVNVHPGERMRRGEGPAVDA